MDENDKNLIEFSPKNLVKALTEVDIVVYRAIIIEIVAFLNWLHRFADGLIKDE